MWGSVRDAFGSTCNICHIFREQETGNVIEVLELLFALLELLHVQHSLFGPISCGSNISLVLRKQVVEISFFQIVLYG